MISLHFFYKKRACLKKFPKETGCRSGHGTREKSAGLEGREPEENVMPIVPPGNALDDMILESGDRFFETSRAMENCLFEVNCIMGRRTIDIILFVGIIVCLIITAYTGYATIEKLKGERADSRYLRRDCIQGIFTVSFGENFSGTIAVSLGSSFPI